MHSVIRFSLNDTKPDKMIFESANILLFFSTLLQTHLGNCQYLCWLIDSSSQSSNVRLGTLLILTFPTLPPSDQSKRKCNSTFRKETSKWNTNKCFPRKANGKKWNYLTKIYHYSNTNRYFVFSVEIMLGLRVFQILKPGLSVYAGFILFTLSPDTLHLESIVIQAV